MDATVAALRKAVANTIKRRGQVYLLNKAAGVGEDAWVSTGRITGGEANFNPVLSDSDTSGRDSVTAYMIEVTFTMMQTTATELGAVSAMAAPAADGPDANGYTVALTDGKPTTVSDPDELGATGVGFKNALLKPSPTLNLGDGKSATEVSFKGEVSVEALRVLANTAAKNGNVLDISEFIDLDG